MTKPLRILLLEDNPADAELIQFELEDACTLFTAKVVTTEEDFIRAIHEFSPDLILSDYDLPRYNGALALAEVRENYPDIPFILVSGVISDDRAIEILTQGAKDYVLKNRLQQRLVPAVKRALAEVEEYRARRRAEMHNVVIAEIGRVVSSTLNIEEVYEQVATEVNKAIPYDKLLIALKEPNTNQYIVAHISGMNTRNHKVGDSVSLAGTTVGAVIERCAGILVQPEDREEIKEVYPHLHSDYGVGLRSVLAVPLIFKGEVIGCMNLRAKRAKAFTDRDLQLAEGIGRQIAGAIFNAQLFTKLTETERALRESEERYRSLFERSPIQTMTVDREGRVTEYNLAKRRSGDRLPNIGDVLYKDYASKHEINMYEELIRCIKKREQKEFPELRYRSKYLFISISPFEKGAIVSSIDVTDRKITEEKIKASLSEKEVLLKEIHHRVKNNLQIISSLLSLKTQHTKDKRVLPVFRASQDRIRSMAAVHGMLYKSENFSEIDFGDYLRDVTAQLFRSYNVNPEAISLSIHADNVRFAMDTAIPCGLIATELITNSLKHAFPEGRRGEITIGVNRDDNGVTIVFADDGVGFPKGVNFRRTETMGLQLVNILADQLDGSVKMDRKGGTRFTITLKNKTAWR